MVNTVNEEISLGQRLNQRKKTYGRNATTGDRTPHHPEIATLWRAEVTAKSQIDTGQDPPLAIVKVDIVDYMTTGNTVIAQDQASVHTTADGHVPHPPNGGNVLAMMNQATCGHLSHTRNLERLCRRRMSLSEVTMPLSKATVPLRINRSPTSGRQDCLPRKQTPSSVQPPC